MERYLTLCLLILVSIFSTAQNPPNAANINSVPFGHTVINYKRIGDSLYVSYRNYLTPIITPPVIPEYPTNYPGTKYYVNNLTGLDTNNGLTPATAFKSLSRASTTPLTKGSAILLNSIDTFIGTLTPNGSGVLDSSITIAPYGSLSSKPKIYGSRRITGWSVHSGSIYKATFTTTINQLFVNGVRMTPARLTNIGVASLDQTDSVHYGYNWIETLVSQTRVKINVPDVYSDNYFQNCKVNIRATDSWDVDTRTVTTSQRDTLTLSSSLEQIKEDQGIIIMGKKEFIDSPGEWIQEGTIVYLQFPTGLDTTAVVRGSTEESGIILDGKSYITISNLEILEQQTYGIKQRLGTGSGAYPKGIRIENNIIKNQELYGIYIQPANNASAATVRNNTVYNQNAAGIFGRRIGGSEFSNNTIYNIGLFENWGLNGPTLEGQGTGLYVSMAEASTYGKNIIKDNNVKNTGWSGLFWRGEAEVDYNRIDSTLLAVHDGGGLYTDDSKSINSKVRYNIVTNVIGTYAGTTFTTNGGYALYLDEKSKGVLAENNTLVNASVGVFLHRPFGHTVQNNTTFNTGTQLVVKGSYLPAYDYTDPLAITKVVDNLFVSNASGQLMTYTGPSYALKKIYATINNNKYKNPFANKNVWKHEWVVGTGANQITTNFSRWRDSTSNSYNGTKFELNTTPDDALLYEKEQRVVFNETNNEQKWRINNAFQVKDKDGVTLADTFLLAKFESKYLIGRYLDFVDTLVNNEEPEEPSFDLIGNIVAWYEGNTANGTTVEDEVSTDQATLIGGAVINQTGSLGKAVAFDGTDGYMTAPVSNVFATGMPNDFSVVVRFKQPVAEANNKIFVAEISTADFCNISVSNGVFTGNVAKNNVRRGRSIAGTLSTTEWYTAVVTFESGTNTLKVYLNGTECTVNTDASVPGVVQGSTTMKIARMQASTTYANLLWETLGVFDRVLTQEEITWINNKQFSDL